MKNPVFSHTKGLEVSFAEMHSPYNMMRRHYHDKYEIFLVLDGERNLFFDNKKYLLEKGSLFVMEPFLPHATTSTDKLYFKRYLVNIAPNDFLSMLSPDEIAMLFYSFSTCVLNLNDNIFQEIYSLMEDVGKHNQENGTLARKLTQVCLIRLVEIIVRESRLSSAIKLESTTKKNETPIMQALRYININFNENITLDFISEYAHMSKSNFCLVFKKVVGETFVDYLNTIRVSQVHKLLLTTNMPLGAIAEKTGFSSVDYMTYSFKKIHGISPSLMRRENVQTNKQEFIFHH